MNGSGRSPTASNFGQIAEKLVSDWRPPNFTSNRLFLATDREGREVTSDVFRIEGRPREGADRMGRASGPSLRSQSTVINIRPKDPPRGYEPLTAHLGLPPAYHLCVEPGRLGGVGPWSVLPSN